MTFSYVIVEDIINPSNDRIEPDCCTYRKCGGCSFRHISYEAELKAKQSFVKDSFERIGKLGASFDDIIGCKDIYHYRNKAQYPVCEKNGRLRCGFYSKRSHRIVDNRDCSLQPENFNEIVNFTDELLSEKGFKAYDEESGNGQIRHIYIRHGFNTEEIMLCIVATENSKHFKDISAEISNKFSKIKSIVLNINPNRTNVILGSQNIVLFPLHFFVLRSAPINYFCFHNEFCLTYVPFSLCGNSHVEKPDAPSVSLHAYGQSFCGIPHTRF